MSMLRTIKPKNARVKRALEKREPQAVEGEKTAIFVRGNSTSERVRVALKDLYVLKRPHAISFSKKNDIHPFDSPASLEFFASKNDASLFVTGLHSKKRPDDLIFTRMFDGRVLDMIELGIEGIKPMTDFESGKSSVGSRPLMVFHSDLFDSHPTFQLLKSILLDFYGGHTVAELPLNAVEHVISITAGPLATSSTSTTLPLVHMRVFTVKVLASGTGAPRTVMKEMGPSIDFSVRRTQEANEEVWKMATKKAKIAKTDVEKGLGKKRKNIETDEMGDRVGRIHVGRQDLGKLQARKVRALKTGAKPKEVVEDGDAAMESD